MTTRLISWLSLALAALCLILPPQRAAGQGGQATPVTFVAQKEVNPKDEEAAVALLRRALAFEKAGKLKEAIPIREELVEKVKKLYGANSTGVAAQMNNLADLYVNTGAYKKAESMYLLSLGIAEDKFGKDHLHVSTTLNNLALVYRHMGEYEKSKDRFLRSLEIQEDKLGKDHLQVASTLSNLALLHWDAARYPEAESACLRALRIREAKLDKNHPSVALSLNNLAEVYRGTARFRQAEALLLRALAIYEAPKEGHPLLATALNNLALLYQDMGRFEKAEPRFVRAIEIDEERLGKDHPGMAPSLNNLAALYYHTGRYEKAETLYLRVLAIAEDKLGKDNPRTATSASNLAELYRDAGRYQEAEKLALRALKMREDRLGKDHSSVAVSLNSLAGLYRLTDRNEKAEPLFLRAIRIAENKHGKDHPAVATYLNNLAMVYLDTGHPKKAEPLLIRALAIDEEKKGKDHPDAAVTRNTLAGLYAARGEHQKAADHFDRSRRGSRRHLFAILPSLSEPDRAAFFARTSARANLDAALSLGLARKSNSELVALSASWLINGKAPEQESLASAALMSRQSDDPTVGKLTSRLLAVRGSLARLTFSPPIPGQEKQRQKQIEEMTGEEQELARDLRQAGSKAAPPDWVELANLRKSLPADGVLIDIARCGVYDFEAKQEKRWQPARYVAWITPPKGDVKVIDLGPADKIDAAIKGFRQAIEGAVKELQQGEEKAEKAIRVHLDALSKLILTPLLPHIGTSKRWLISPDGNLWLVPFETLTLKDGKYAIEDYHIHYFTTGRDLIPSVAPRVKVTAPLVLADPDFDLDADKARAAAKKLGLEADAEETRSVSGVLRLGQIRRLPGTAAEAKAIVPSLKSYTGVQPRLHTREQALEAVFKSVKNPRVVVLATHGFFLPDREKSTDEKKAKPRWENPLLRSGLLLAGCNKPSKEGDDGILTALEVVGTDLRGCELVVLSACETGVGDVQTGEGVSGLRQAFQLAGAKAVVSTLWQVPDKQSARLMTSFFDDLGKGKLSKADALRAAKLKLIEERRSDFAAAHPFYWAAFTLTGE